MQVNTYMTNFLDYIKNRRHHSLNEALHFEDIEYDTDYILAGRPPQAWKIRALRITYGGADRIIAELDKLIAKHGRQTPIMMMHIPNDENLENLVSRIDTLDQDDYDQDNVWMSFYGDIKFNPTFLPSDQYDWSTEISLAQLKEEAKNSTDDAIYIPPCHPATILDVISMMKTFKSFLQPYLNLTLVFS